MSCYSWQRGTITIPAAAWAKFRKGLLTKWNEKQETLFADAKRAHVAIKAAVKGKRAAARQEAMTDALHRHCGHRKSTWGWENENDERYTALFALVFAREGWSGPVTLQTPKKSALDLKPVSKDAAINLPDARVSFCNAGKTVTWDVEENNRAVEHAHEHWFAKALFAALGRIEWTRNSGGTIVGNDEYNRDRDYEGGGGNYTTHEFSAAKQKADRKAATARRSSYGTGGYYGRRY